MLARISGYSQPKFLKVCIKYIEPTAGPACHPQPIPPRLTAAGMPGRNDGDRRTFVLHARPCRAAMQPTAIRTRPPPLAGAARD